MLRTTRILLTAAVLSTLAACTRDVVVPEIPDCSATYPSGACAAGETCFQATCVAASSLCSPSNSTGTCPAGFSCYGGGCLLTTEVPPEPAACSQTAPNGACSTGETCFMGGCVLTADMCSPTNTDGLCPAGWACYGGGCILQAAVPPDDEEEEEVDCSEHVFTTQPAIAVRTQMTRATGAATLNGVVAGNTFTLGGVTFTAVGGAGAVDSEFVVGANDTATATSLAASVNANAVTHTLVTAATDGPVISFTAAADGVNGNNVTMSATPERFTLSGATLLGGAGTGKTAITVEALQFRDSSGDGTLQPYEDWRLHPICRARDLVGRMGFEQKLGLLMEATAIGGPTSDSIPTPATKAAIVNHHVRQALARSGSAPPVEAMAKYFNNVQEICEAQPLGVPAVFTEDPTHSVNATRWTPFPGTLGLGAINDANLTRQYGDIVREEYRAVGYRWQLGPMADTATEPRWRRTSGTFGENALAAAKHVAACIEGFQGGTDGDLRNGIAATMKHFPGHGAEFKGFDAHQVDGKFAVYPGGNFEYHLIPFQAAIDVHVAAVMPFYPITKGITEWNPLQVPAAFSKGLMTDLLKKRMGFTGMVTGDWQTMTGRPYGMEMLTVAERAALWFEAGSHQFGLEGAFGDPTPPGVAEAHQNGWISDAQIDAAAAKVLELSFKLGVFENPYVDDTQVATIVRSAENRQVGFDAMKKAIVILKRPTAYLPITGDPAQDTNGDGKISVFFDGTTDALLGEDYMSDVLGGYDYGAPASEGKLAIEQAASLAVADIAVIRIGTASGTDPVTGLLSLSYDRSPPNRDKVIDALRVRSGYKDATGTAVPPANSTLRIILVANLGNASILKPWVNGLVSLDATPTAAYPSVADSNVNASATGGVDGLLVDFGAVDRAVLDVVFDQNRPSGWIYGKARLPFEIPASEEAVDAQYEDTPADSWKPTYQIGAGVSY